MPEDDLRYHNV